MGITTNIVHTSFSKPDAHGALQMPIYSNAAFEFESAEQMELAFQGRSADHIYSRLSNPTVENFEQRIRAITGALNVTALSSGMAAISNTLLTIAKAGDNIITSKFLFGNTYSLFNTTLKALGVEPRFCDLTNTDELVKLIDEKTVAVFFETITNPQLEVLDIKALAALTKKHNLVLIADSTITPFHVFDAKSLGVNIEVVSSTKLISGGATSLGGLIVDYGTFAWSKLPSFAEQAKKYGHFAFYAKLRKEIFRNLGACLSPFHAYLQSLGLETLALRYDKAVENAYAIATFLEDQQLVSNVNYPGLASSAYYHVSMEQFKGKPGAIITFELASKEVCFTFLNKLKLINRATNLYDNRTLIMHPASTIFVEFDAQTLAAQRISDKLIRLAIGIEDVEDIQQDIKQALI